VTDTSNGRDAPRSPGVVWHDAGTGRDVRWAVVGGRGASVWLTGLSGSGKSTVAVELLALLTAAGVPAYSLDGDNLRHGLNGDLGFSAADREENIRRVGEVARLFADAGLVAVVPVISPYAAGRAHARRIHEDAGVPFLEVFVDTPLAVCEARDVKGLYAKARSGELTGFTGIDDPYERPADPDLVVDGDATPPAEAAATVVEILITRGVVPESARAPHTPGGETSG
jgi:bifunctional enzyme CysN/CysC